MRAFLVQRPRARIPPRREVLVFVAVAVAAVTAAAAAAASWAEVRAAVAVECHM